MAFSPDASFTARAEALRHKNKVSAFDGSELFGIVDVTWLRGVPVYSIADPGSAIEPSGRLLSRT